KLLLMGLVSAAGVAFVTIELWIPGSLAIVLLCLVILSAFFARTYFTPQRDRIAVDFFDRLIPALAYARSKTTQHGQICVTGQVNMPQIYTLFSDHNDPREYLRSVKYVDPSVPFRLVASYGRYTFGLQRC